MSELFNISSVPPDAQPLVRRDLTETAYRQYEPVLEQAYRQGTVYVTNPHRNAVTLKARIDDAILGHDRYAYKCTWWPPAGHYANTMRIYYKVRCVDDNTVEVKFTPLTAKRTLERHTRVINADDMAVVADAIEAIATEGCTGTILRINYTPEQAEALDKLLAGWQDAVDFERQADYIDIAYIL